MGYRPQRPWGNYGPPRPTFPENATAFLEDCEAWWAWLKVATPEQIEDEPASGHRWLRSMGWQPPHLLLPVGVNMSGRLRRTLSDMGVSPKPAISPKGQCSHPPRDP